MKTKNEILFEQSYCEVYTLSEYARLITNGKLSISSGIGYYHDGNEITNTCIEGNNRTWEQIRNYPYICFFKNRV